MSEVGTGRARVPGPVRTVVVLLYVAGVLVISVSLVNVLLTNPLLAVGLLAVGVGYLVLGVLLSRANRIARTVAVVLLALSAVASGLDVGHQRTGGGSVVGALLCLLLIYLLLGRPSARRFFGDPA